MKTIFTFLIILFAQIAQAQNNCQTAKPFCAGGVSGETFPATTNITSAQTGPNYGCLGSTPNPAWYFLQISQSGNLDILIQGIISNPPPATPGQDVDFICWGPFNSMNGICDSLNANKIVDCSYSGSFTETLNIPNGVTGQYYMVLITNFANVVQDIEFTQYDGTGSTNCGLVGSNSKICSGSSATIVATNSGSLTTPAFSIAPLGLTNTTGTFIVSPTVTTTYTLFISGTNNLNQPTTQTAVAHVTVNPQPAAAPQVTNTTCTSTVNALALNLSFATAGGPPSYTINWNPTPNGIASAQQQSVTGGIGANVYNATITAAGGCSVATSLTVDPTPEPAIIDIQPPGIGYTLTCLNPVLSLSTTIASNNYTWTNNNNTYFTGQFGSLTYSNTGSYVVNAINPASGCTATKTFVVGQNTLTPSNTVTPMFQNITCAANSINTVSMSATPSVNVTHVIYSPLGASVVVNSYSTSYIPGGPGVYIDCVINDANGCSDCRQFTVNASQGYPTFNVSSPQSFTLGCNSTSVAVLNINNASATNTNQVPTGGAVSYTLLAPGASSILPAGQLSALSVYSVNAPGIYTIVTKDNVTFCETRVPVSILSNTLPPSISAELERQVIDCAHPSVKLLGKTETPNVSFEWKFDGSLVQPGDSIRVSIDQTSATSTLVGNYTLQITDNSSTCKSTSIVPIYQNIFIPNVVITNGGTASLTCNTASVTLTNLSTTGIKGSFPTNQAVVASLWQGPTPQLPVKLSTTYIGTTPGVYTLTAKDLNNGCTNTGTINIIDNKIYPSLAAPAKQQVFACGVVFDTVRVEVKNFVKDMLFSWAPPPGVAIQNATVNPLLSTGPGLFKVVVRNPINGCATSTEIKVDTDSLSAAFSLDKTEGFAPLNVSLNNLSKSKADNLGVVSYWNFGNGTFTTTASASVSPLAIYAAPGTYTIKLTAFKGICNAIAQHTVMVESPSSLKIPNVFTPNNDNINDVFFLDATNLTEIVFSVTDRWGHVVYDLTSASGNIAWDGNDQTGANAAAGVYFYVLKAQGKDGQSYTETGTITLIR